MTKHTITLHDVEIPEGWEATGEFRVPEHGEQFLGNDNNALMAVGHCGRYLILRRIWTWPEFLGQDVQSMRWDESRKEWVRHLGTLSLSVGSVFSMAGIVWNPPPDKSVVYRNPNYRGDA